RRSAAQGGSRDAAKSSARQGRHVGSTWCCPTKSVRGTGPTPPSNPPNPPSAPGQRRWGGSPAVSI
ncbi:hypothetical protein IXO159_13470, partial [Xanthomonas oryzae pv. oryzae]